MKILKDYLFWRSLLFISGIGLLSGIFAIDAKAYYSVLQLPFFAPPAWLFGPAWTILYIMIGVAFYYLLIDKTTAKSQQNQMLFLFLLQFTLNIMWTAIFFVVKSNLLATVDITCLWLVLLVQLRLYYQVNKKVFVLMCPYFLWVTYATMLTYAILFLN